MKLAVVTGCLGFIGSHVTRKLLEENWKIFGVDKCTYAANMDALEEFTTNENFDFIDQDISKLTHLPDCDFVINLAAESHVGNSIINSDEFMSSNILGTKNILDLIRKKPKNTGARPVLIHFSTDEVYGDLVSGSHSEKDILKPSNPYSAAKASADMLIFAWARTYGIKYNILRPTNNYGTHQYPEKLLPISVKCLQRGVKIRLHDKGLPIRCWLHAEDTATAVLAVISQGQRDKIYNISGEELENREVVKLIIESYFDNAVDWNDHVDLGHIREGQDIRYSVNDDKLRSLGWQPQKKFKEEVKSITTFYKTNFRW